MACGCPNTHNTRRRCLEACPGAFGHCNTRLVDTDKFNAHKQASRKRSQHFAPPRCLSCRRITPLPSAQFLRSSPHGPRFRFRFPRGCQTLARQSRRQLLAQRAGTCGWVSHRPSYRALQLSITSNPVSSLTLSRARRSTREEGKVEEEEEAVPRA